MADRRRPPSPCRHDGDHAKSVNFCRNPVCGSSTSDIPAMGGQAHTCYRAHDLSQLRRSRPGSGSLDRVGCESLSVRGRAPGRTHRSPPTRRSVDMFGRARAQCSGARRRRDSDPQRQTALDRVPAGRGCGAGDVEPLVGLLLCMESESGSARWSQRRGTLCQSTLPTQGQSNPLYGESTRRRSPRPLVRIT